MPRIIHVAPGETGTTIRVKELESGRGYTHLHVARDPKNSPGTVILEGRRPCLMPWLKHTKIRHGVVHIPEGGTARVSINGDELLPRVEHHKRGPRYGMYHKRGEPSAHHIEGGGAATTVANADFSKTVTMWEGEHEQKRRPFWKW